MLHAAAVSRDRPQLLFVYRLVKQAGSNHQKQSMQFPRASKAHAAPTVVTPVTSSLAQALFTLELAMARKGHS
jgi:hypothetical protein